MASTSQKAAAKKNIKKAASAAKKKRTIAHLPKSTRTALGKEGLQGRPPQTQIIGVRSGVSLA
jgi:ABC-type transport system involved in Fe-S cluster assembly fused permease/ATPase subunit